MFASTLLRKLCQLPWECPLPSVVGARNADVLGFSSVISTTWSFLFLRAQFFSDANIDVSPLGIGFLQWR